MELLLKLDREWVLMTEVSKCPQQANCLKYVHNKRHKVKDSFMRENYICVHWVDNDCEIKEEVAEAYRLLELQQGEACQLKKIRRINK